MEELKAIKLILIFPEYVPIVLLQTACKKKHGTTDSYFIVVASGHNTLPRRQS